MPIRLGTPELLIILAIIVLVFGVGRLGRIGGEMGNAIRQFREGLTGGEKNKDEKAATVVEQPEKEAEKK